MLAARDAGPATSPCPSGKVPYPDHVSALRWTGKHPGHGDLHPYRCELCLDWHLTSKPRGIFRRLRRSGRAR